MQLIEDPQEEKPKEHHVFWGISLSFIPVVFGLSVIIDVLITELIQCAEL